MSRRTKWRSIIEIIIGLLKNFLKTSKERRSLDLWLHGCTNYLLAGSFSKLGLWSSPAQTHQARLGLEAKLSDGCPRLSNRQWNAPQAGARGAGRLDRSHLWDAPLPDNTTARWGSLTIPMALPPPRAFPSSSSTWERAQERKRGWGTKRGTDIFGFLKQKLKSREVRKLKKERIKSESMNRKIWLTNPPTFCIQFYTKGKKTKTPTHHNAVQIFATKDVWKYFNWNH